MLHHMYSSSLSHEIFKSAELGSKSISQLYYCLFQEGGIKEELNKVQASLFAVRTLKWH